MSFCLALTHAAMLLSGLLASSRACAEPPAEDWIVLFNGRDLTGWTPKITGHPLGENFGRTFRVEEGLLRVRYDEYRGFDQQFGHLFYETPFSYYRLALEYRFVGRQADRNPGAWALRNSGVMLHSQAPRTMLLNQHFPLSIETQFLGGLGDGKPRPTMNVCTPGTEIMYRGQIHPEHCLSSTSGTFDGDQWVRVEVVVHGADRITHYVNGREVLEYSASQYEANVAADYGVLNKPAGAPLAAGHIALQSESHPIDFRKIELLDLAGCMDPKASNYKSYVVKSVPDRCIYGGGGSRAGG